MAWSGVTIAVGIFIHLCYIIAYLKQDNSVMTFFWPVGLVIIASISYLNVNSNEIGLQFLLVLTLLWGLRLFVYVFFRNIKRGY